MNTNEIPRAEGSPFSVKDTRAMVLIDNATPKNAGAQAIFPGPELEALGFTPETIQVVLKRMEKRNMMVWDGESQIWRRPGNFGRDRFRAQTPSPMVTA